MAFRSCIVLVCDYYFVSFALYSLFSSLQTNQKVISFPPLNANISIWIALGMRIVDSNCIAKFSLSIIRFKNKNKLYHFLLSPIPFHCFARDRLQEAKVIMMVYVMKSFIRKLINWLLLIHYRDIGSNGLWIEFCIEWDF